MNKPKIINSFPSKKTKEKELNSLINQINKEPETKNKFIQSAQVDGKKKKEEMVKRLFSFEKDTIALVKKYIAKKEYETSIKINQDQAINLLVKAGAEKLLK